MASKLKAIELALDHHSLEYVLDRSGVTIYDDDWAKLYEFDINDAAVEKVKNNLIEFMAMCLSDKQTCGKELKEKYGIDMS